MYTFMLYVLVVCVQTALVAGETKNPNSPRPGTPVVNRVKDTDKRTSPRNIDKPVGDHFRKSHGVTPVSAPSQKERSKSQPSFNPKSTKVKIPNS